MRFLTMIKTAENDPMGPPPPSLTLAIAELGHRATTDGTLLEQGGLLPSTSGALVTMADGRVTVAEGPFAEGQLVVAGYAMFQLRSRDEAIEMARRFMAVHAAHWPGAVAACEVRRLAD